MIAHVEALLNESQAVFSAHSERFTATLSGAALSIGFSPQRIRQIRITDVATDVAERSVFVSLSVCHAPAPCKNGCAD